MRIVLGIEYNGAPFSGWQIQEGTATIQGCIEDALAKVADHPVRVICAGRTDTGVHAMEQIVHFDTQVEREGHAWVLGANANSPQQISVLWSESTDDEFHARFSAIRRCYRFVILNRKVRPSLLESRVTWDYRLLDEEKMGKAARYLCGEHDFSSFRATACQAKSPIRTVYRLDVTRKQEFIFIDIEANAFLHHMVRNIAGVLMEIGAGQKEPEWVRELLEEKDRTCGGVTAPPHGLYLMGVRYPDKYNLPYLSRSPLVW